MIHQSRKHFLFIIVLCLLLGTSIKLEASADSSRARTADADYPKLHLSFRPQPGYSLAVSYKKRPDEPTGLGRTIYSVGLVHSVERVGDDGSMYYSQNLFFELNRMQTNSYYGLLYGYDTKGLIFDMGLYLHAMSDFRRSFALALRPRFGFSFLRLTNLDIFVETDIYLLTSRFDYNGHYLLGLQYTLGVVQTKKSLREIFGAN